MFLINGQVYLDLEPYVDMEGLMKIEKDIIYGIVKSRNSFTDGGASYHNFYDPSVPSLLDQCWKPQITDPNNPNYEYFKKLDFSISDCRMFARYALRNRQMGQTIHLRNRPQGGSVGKANADENVDTKLYQHFPTLKKWINNLKIFDSIGRIVFWFNAPGEGGAIHKDQFIGRPDHFILINLNLDSKDLFVLDNNGNKHIIKSRAFAFDGRNFHGTQGKDSYSYTFRIDGVYNKEWAESIGVWDHFNTEIEHEQLPDRTSGY